MLLGEYAGQEMHCASMLQLPHHSDLEEEPNHQEDPQIEHLPSHFKVYSLRARIYASLSSIRRIKELLPKCLPHQTFPGQATTLTVMPLNNSVSEVCKYG